MSVRAKRAQKEECLNCYAPKLHCKPEEIPHLNIAPVRFVCMYNKEHLSVYFC